MPEESNKDSATAGATRQVHQAIGEFMVAFSQLHHTAHINVCSALSQKGPSDAFLLAWTALGERGTQETFNSYFAICQESKKSIWKKGDFAILKALRKRVQHLIEIRNRLAHDLWTVGPPYRDPPEGFHAIRIRNYSSASKGYVHSQEPIQVETLATQTAAIKNILPIISHIGALVACREPDLLTDHFEIDSDGNVFRRKQPPA